MQSIAKNLALRKKIALIKIKLKSILYNVRKNPFFLTKRQYTASDLSILTSSGLAQHLSIFVLLKTAFKNPEKMRKFKTNTFISCL